MRIFKNLLALSFLLIISSCGEDKSSTSNQKERPHSPYVFRSVLDQQARMVTLAMSDNIWAAYSTNDCALYKAWRGNVNFDGPVYTSAHGPQPTTIGNAYMQNSVKEVWKLTDANGTNMNAKIDR